MEDPSSPDCVCVCLSEAPSLEGSPREHSQYSLRHITHPGISSHQQPREGHSEAPLGGSNGVCHGCGRGQGLISGVGQVTSASLIHSCFPWSLPVVPHCSWGRTAAQLHLSPERGGFQKQRTLSSGVYTSLYKIIKSSINMQLYTEPNPSLGWPVELGGKRGVKAGECPIWGQMRVEVHPPRDQPRGLELVTSGSSREGILPGQVCMCGGG